MWQTIFLIVVAAAVLAYFIYSIVKVVKMPPEARKEIIKKWLVGVIVAAEEHFSEPGQGKEKLEEVIAEFNKNAPLVCKILLKITNSISLNDLVEESLSWIKSNFEE